jgi:hypothetical protein
MESAKHAPKKTRKGNSVMKIMTYKKTVVVTLIVLLAFVTLFSFSGLKHVYEHNVLAGCALCEAILLSHNGLKTLCFFLSLFFVAIAVKTYANLFHIQNFFVLNLSLITQKTELNN